ncbi:MAG TPA: altronate dehydratase family protein, partial [Tepidisphaeraceae bacterium]|nr:altronate dehydratase family protein [Tepidisphaeraceae bacterium]
MAQLLRITDSDNVAVALEPLQAGTTVDGLTLQDDIPQAHKVALKPIGRGEKVIKYGYPIGIAARDIAAGMHVHVQNVESGLRENLANLKYNKFAGTPAPKPAIRTFEGYRRPDGRVATRNEIWIVNTVGCVNHASQRIADAASKRFAGTQIEGVHAFPHPFGCSQLGDDLANTQRVLAGLVKHPNAAAVLVLGLGCENNQMKLFMEHVGQHDASRVKFFNAQDVSDEVESGLQAIEALAGYAEGFKRESIPASELILGMKCGGSDGFSGITGNPLVGRIADKHCSAGGTTLLTEVPEMFGAEQVLLDRAADEHVFGATVKLVNSFRDYFRKYDQPIDENPSPGNKDGGITTLAEKSLGCVQKGGRAMVKQVLGYGEPAQPGLGGLALLNAPGNDGVSSTAMTIAGAHMVLFTTGRGTPMGFPASTIKIATNTGLAQRKPQWIDFDAGVLASESAGLDATADKLFDLVLDVASRRTLTKN